jgi:predicted GH43/DUF377 family glycosyl hydrolase
MHLVRHPGNPILRPDAAHAWEAGSVLNGTVLQEDDGLVRMLYRATNDVLVTEKDGYVSSIGYAESRDGVHFRRRPTPLIVPDQPFELGLGCEDPRVVRIGDEYLIYYTAVEGMPPRFKVRIALATTRDFRTVVKHGVVGPAGSPSKAATLFPEAIDGRYLWFFTWCSDTPASTVLHVRFDSLAQVRCPPRGLVADALEHYTEHAVLIAGDPAEGTKTRVRRGPELGAPPIRTPAGWLLIYCNSDGEERPEWQISAALLDSDRPWRVIARTPRPLLRPETDAELTGVVDRVTFPSGAFVRDGDLYVYYGTGDQGIALATCRLADLLEHLDANRVDGDSPCVT